MFRTKGGGTHSAETTPWRAPESLFPSPLMLVVMRHVIGIYSHALDQPSRHTNLHPPIERSSFVLTYKHVASWRCINWKINVHANFHVNLNVWQTASPLQ